jgi:GT2 family glycosyltransferase
MSSVKFEAGSVCAVVVTFNRLALLQESIAALRAQTRRLNEIVVVNNSSTDGTVEWLAAQADLSVVTQENLGGAGGFYTGIKTAFEKGHAWFWCMDDDTVPAPAALERMLASLPAADPQTGFLASLVVWTDGAVHRMNVPMLTDTTERLPRLLEERTIPIRWCSFVSVLIRREMVARAGLPVREMFVWFDDSEYTRRLGAISQGHLVLDSVALHKTRSNEPATYTPANHARYLIGLRNEVYFYRTAPDRTRVGRLRGVAKVWWRTFKGVVARKLPAAALAWCVRGLFFNPRITWPDPAPAGVPRIERSAGVG